ncbi:putative disease resistance protein RGA3 [Zingiber officinale]|uniref:putative disease resistance protein RGA3 n=1 Tax=Zingiber officinale TaxID=94328 RepID=UPI001C4D6611|nr:putative disease resistance protein RGA3 [Zingiber officinale]
MATASKLRHVLMKILPAPEMVAQGKTFHISNHLDMIRNSLWTINSFLLDATLSVVEQPDVAEWMKDVGVAVEDVDSLLKRILDYWEPNEEDEVEKKRMMISNFLSMSSRQAILVELKDMACMLNYLVNRGAALGLWVETMDSMDPTHDDYSAILNEEVIGREEDIDQIIELLQQQQCDEDGNAPFIITLEGTMNGKTTLARTIYHHPWVHRHFQHRIWLDAPLSIRSIRDFKSNVIAKEIAKYTGKSCTNTDYWPLINEHFGGDRYLLILDGVQVSHLFAYKWKEFMLKLLHCGAPGSKVILTGDCFYVFGMEFYIKNYKLNMLSEDTGARILLRYSTFVHPIEANSNHKEKASPAAVTDMQIPLKYPLLVKGLGLIYRRINTRLDKEILRRYDLDTLLKYYSWPIERERYFQYQELFGRYSNQCSDEDLFEILVAEGTLRYNWMKNTEYDVPFNFKTDPCFFRMKAWEGSRIPLQCRHLYLPIHSKNISKIKKVIEKAGVANRLRTLILHMKEKKEQIYQYQTVSKILESMFVNLKHLCTLHMGGIMIQDLPSSVGTLHCLRYLNLAENKIETLPESLCYLGNLCVLNLSSCNKLKELPRQIHKLRKLQILKLSGFLRIQKLPESITWLVNLKELDVGDCCYLSKLPDDLCSMKNLMQLKMHGCASLTRMPIGIGQLTNLEVLQGYDAIDGLGNVMLSELQTLTNLESLHIRHLERLELAEEKNISPPTNLLENQCLNELMLHWEWWNDMVAEGTLEPTMQLTQSFQHNLRDLIVLKMVSYMSDKFPSWLMIADRDSLLNNLTTVHLINLRRCERLPPLGHLRNLKEVAISGFDSVKVVDETFYGKDHNCVFLHLRRLTFSEMPRLEKWVGLKHTQSRLLFRSLKELTLIQCPKLKEFHMRFPESLSLKLFLSNEMLMPISKFVGWQNLRQVNMLQIFGCQELRNLPDGLRMIPNLETLEIINCNKLEALPIWLKKSRLKSLCLSGCPALSFIPEELKFMERLTNLYVEACPKLQSQLSEVCWCSGDF